MQAMPQKPHPYLVGTPEQQAAAQRAQDIQAAQGSPNGGKPERLGTGAKAQ